MYTLVLKRGILQIILNITDIYNLFILSLITGITIFISFVYLHSLFLLNYFVEWWVLSILLLWVMSSFKFFLKKYKFSKFTSSTLRFWRRLFNVFWIVELCWFIMFTYCLFTASHLPIHFEEQFFYKTRYLASWRIFLLGALIVVPILAILYYLINYCFFFLYNQFILLFLLLTVMCFIYLYNELYQFFTIITFFIEPFWVVNSINNFEIYPEYWHFRPRLAFSALVNMARFWHYIFILGGWVIFFIKIVETKKISIPLIAMNSQNLIIFYIITWLPLFLWVKFFFKKYFRQLWSWFFLTPVRIRMVVFYGEFKLYYSAVFNFNISLLNLLLFNNICKYKILRSPYPTIINQASALYHIIFQ